MSLRESVEQIVEEMRLASVEWDERDEDAADTFRLYVRLLNVALKASEGEEESLLPVATPLPYRGKAKEDALEIKVKEQVQKEEASGEIMTEIADGPLAGDNIMRPASMPLGARTNIAGSVYELKEDRRFHYVKRSGV